MGKLVNYLKLRSPKLILIQIIIFILFLMIIPELIYQSYSSPLLGLVFLKKYIYNLITFLFFSTYFYINREKEQAFMNSLNLDVRKIQAKIIIFHATIVLLITMIYTLLMVIISLKLNIDLSQIITEDLLFLLSTLIMYNGVSLFKIHTKFKQIFAVILIMILCIIISVYGVKYMVFSFLILIIVLVNNVVKNFSFWGKSA